MSNEELKFYDVRMEYNSMIIIMMMTEHLDEQNNDDDVDAVSTNFILLFSIVTDDGI